MLYRRRAPWGRRTHGEKGKGSFFAFCVLHRIHHALWRLAGSQDAHYQGAHECWTLEREGGHWGKRHSTTQASTKNSEREGAMKASQGAAGRQGSGAPGHSKTGSKDKGEVGRRWRVEKEMGSQGKLEKEHHREITDLAPHRPSGGCGVKMEKGVRSGEASTPGKRSSPQNTKIRQQLPEPSHRMAL